MIRALISTSTFPIPGEEGTPRFVFDLALALTGQCEVTALAPGAPQAPRVEHMGGVEVRRFDYFVPRRWQSLAYGYGMRSNLRASWPKALQVPSFIAAQAAATRSLVQSERIQVVNSHWLVPQGLSTALARGSGKRFGHVVSVHAGDVYLLRRLPFGRAVVRYVLDRADYLMADGREVLDSVVELVGRPIPGLVQPMGVHLDVFRERRGHERVDSPFPGGFLLFVGRLVEKKGLHYLLQAMPRVRQQEPGLGLVIVGSGPLEAQLRGEVRERSLDDFVIFAGRQPHREIARNLRSCRLLVVPSVVDSHGEADGMPTVVVEGMASGAIVVGTRVGGIPDVIRDRENGWLCREKDAGDLAEKILAALSDAGGGSIRRNASKTAAGLDWTCVAARYRKVFERVCTRDRRP